MDMTVPDNKTNAGTCEFEPYDPYRMAFVSLDSGTM